MTPAKEKAPRANVGPANNARGNIPTVAGVTTANAPLDQNGYRGADATQAQIKFEKTLRQCPAPGNGVHAWILSCANWARYAGVDEATAETRIVSAMTRKPKPNELRDAIRKAYASTGASTAPPAPKTVVSIFKGVRDIKGHPENLRDILDGIRSGKWRAPVEDVRYATGSARDNAKKRLPAFTPAGVFTVRKKSGLASHSGCVVVDLDNLPGIADASSVRDTLALDSATLAAFISPGGRGVKALVAVETCTDAAEHEAAFAAIAKDYAERHQMNLDPSGKDVSRLCFVSYDPDAFIRKGPAAVFKWRNRDRLTIESESIADFLAVPPPRLDCVVEELFEPGDKGEIIAPSKARKSFFAIDLAIHIAAGRDFLCFKIPNPRRVLLFNLEIKPAWMKRRFFRRLAAYGIRPEEIRETLRVVNARGKGQIVREQAVESVKRAGAEVAIVDPRYKLLLPTESENAGGGVQGVLDLQDQMAEAGAAAILVGHDGKGTAGDKDDRDRGAGSGWTGRDCDFRIVLSPHADDPQDALVLSLMRRNFPPFESVTLRHDGDAFQLDEETAPRKETSYTRKQTAKAAAPLDSYKPTVLAVLRKEGKPLPAGVLVARVSEACKIGEKRARALISAMEDAGELGATPRQSTKGGEVRRGLPEQIQEWMKPRLPMTEK